MFSNNYLYKLDQKIQKDATSKVPTPKVGTGNTCNTTVPTIVVHNKSPGILCSPVAPESEDSLNQTSEEGEKINNHKMSLDDEPVINHGSAVNTMSAQRPINCLPVPPSNGSPVKQSSVSSLPSVNRSTVKSNSVPFRSKSERNLPAQECFENEAGVIMNNQRLRGNPKVKLLQRSHAVREETSPPREADVIHAPSNNDKVTVNKSVNGVGSTNSSNLVNNNSNSNSINNNNKAGSVITQSTNTSFQSGNSLQVNNNTSRPNSRHKLRHQSSSQGSMDNSSPCLSRDSSTEQYTDNSGIDLNQFIADTLNRNSKDRMLLLQIEQDLISLVKDRRSYQKFPVMSSYQRMLVHRVAAFFGMEHNVDQTGQCVIVNVTSSTRIPEIRFNELIREDYRFSEEPRRCILKRDSSSFEEGMQPRSPERQLSGDSRRSKSFEEREEEYERARKRIFNRDNGLPMGSPYRCHDINSRSSHEDLRWHGESQAWSSSDNEISSARGRLISVPRMNRISKVESFEGNDTLKANSLKNSVSKSYSFGGYPGMTRGDSVSSCSSRALMKQADSVTSSVSSTRLSPSSSGYKSQSTRSDATASATPSPNQAISQCSFSPEPNTVVWAVSSLTAVPAGAVLINPSSGQPYTNPDGSLYRYDPDNPIKLCPTIEEDVNPLSSLSGEAATGNATLEHVINEKPTADTSVKFTDTKSSANDVTADKSTAILINSSTSPSLPELPCSDGVSAKEGKASPSEPARIDNAKKKENSSQHDEASRINARSGHTFSNLLETISVEVAQTNCNGAESENNICNDNIGGNSGGVTTNSQNETKDFSAPNNAVTYQVNFAANNNVQSVPEYGSRPASSGAYLNSNIGVSPINYAVGPPYGTETVHMPPEVIYSQPVVYAAEQPTNPYAVVPAPPSNTAVAGPPPPPLAAPAPVPAPPPGPTYESRPNENNPNVSVPELSSYFMGLNIGSEQMPPATTSAPQMGYWGPSPNTSQTQGSSHSSQILYYFPGNLPTGTIHPKYTPAGPSMYTYNVPPVMYPTEMCQSMIPGNTATVYPAPYYAPTPTTNMSYRAQTPPTPSAVAATAMAPGFFIYHSQAAAASGAPPPPPPPQPPPIQFGVVRPQQQQVPGIRSSPPPGPRARMPYNRSISERTRHGSLNVDPKPSNLHFSSPLSVYGLRFVPGEIQPFGMMRPVPNVRPITANSNATHHPNVSRCSSNDSILTTSRPPRPRKQR